MGSEIGLEGMSPPAYYVCRPHDPAQALGPGVSLKRCTRCRGLIDVHQPTLNDRLELTAKMGYELVLTCDKCALELDEERVVAVIPSEEEIEEANP